MMPTKTRILAALTIATLPAVALADNDRQPTEDERSAIEAKLIEAGFDRWEEIEFDDGLWEVDDARKPGNTTDEWDLKLHPETLAIVSERLDR